MRLRPEPPHPGRVKGGTVGSRPSGASVPVETPSARGRFRHLDRYRVEREWRRYEGTPQRDLFRQLRERFLQRNARRSGRALEVGPGPGRFSPWVGIDPGKRVLLDLSEAALGYVRDRWAARSSAPVPALVRGDGVRPPLARGRFELVVALGNPLGFAGPQSERLLSECSALLAPGGILVLEAVAGTGARSRYLKRLPPKAVGRLMLAPPNALQARIEREGFEPILAPTRPHHGFRRFTEGDLRAEFQRAGVEWAESLAVAPLLGADPDRVREVSRDPRAWKNLLELEERFGRQVEHREVAASLLVAGVRAQAPPP
ncbi:MAG: class I SAM-dependent methyltransferase [Thermoplasmata archaeon]|nr:class I SAM-dependent methyltransferase [Thermoplasmata archaeon]MCI4358821.1 class I SAM-dependent methyltransferase [Thermoplasmata archaeon]